jgi:hypothetical protein
MSPLDLSDILSGGLIIGFILAFRIANIQGRSCFARDNIHRLSRIIKKIL